MHGKHMLWMAEEGMAPAFVCNAAWAGQHACWLVACLSCSLYVWCLALLLLSPCLQHLGCLVRSAPSAPECYWAAEQKPGGRCGVLLHSACVSMLPGCALTPRRSLVFVVPLNTRSKSPAAFSLRVLPRRCSSEPVLLACTWTCAISGWVHFSRDALLDALGDASRILASHRMRSTPAEPWHAAGPLLASLSARDPNPALQHHRFGCFRASLDKKKQENDSEGRGSIIFGRSLEKERVNGRSLSPALPGARAVFSGMSEQPALVFQLGRPDQGKHASWRFAAAAQGGAAPPLLLQGLRRARGGPCGWQQGQEAQGTQQRRPLCLASLTLGGSSRPAAGSGTSLGLESPFKPGMLVNGGKYKLEKQLGDNRYTWLWLATVVDGAPAGAGAAGSGQQQAGKQQEVVIKVGMWGL